MAGLKKTEGGVEYPARCFLDRRDPKKPSSWSLRTHELVHGKLEMTREQLNKAAVALFSPGYMGNQQKGLRPGNSFEDLRRSLITKYRELGIPDDSLPKGLLPKSQVISHNKPEENFLEHYGTKGMKWGIRKDYRTGGQRLTAKAKSMSTEELKSSIARMQLERQYADLVSKENSANQTRLSRGQDAVTKLIKDASGELFKKSFSKAAEVGLAKASLELAEANSNFNVLTQIFSAKKK